MVNAEQRKTKQDANKQSTDRVGKTAESASNFRKTRGFARHARTSIIALLRAERRKTKQDAMQFKAVRRRVPIVRN